MCMSKTSINPTKEFLQEDERMGTNFEHEILFVYFYWLGYLFTGFYTWFFYTNSLR